jgi:hypothetical protein
MPSATVSNTAKAMTRRGAAIASMAVRSSSVCPPLGKSAVLNTKDID